MRVTVPVAMMGMAKMLVNLLRCRFRGIARSDRPSVSIRLHIQELFYARSNVSARQCRHLITQFDTSPPRFR
jgi:hypothetical protein